jgi:hypothetical protein
MCEKNTDIGPQEAVKTYMEQTKLLITLASAFIIAPPALKDILNLNQHPYRFIVSEVFFIVSVLLGYVVFGTIAGYQQKGKFDIYRSATKWFSIFQFVTLLIGISAFVTLAWPVFNTPEGQSATVGTPVSNPLPLLPSTKPAAGHL